MPSISPYRAPPVARAVCDRPSRAMTDRHGLRKPGHPPGPLTPLPKTPVPPRRSAGGATATAAASPQGTEQPGTRQGGRARVGRGASTILSGRPPRDRSPEAQTERAACRTYPSIPMAGGGSGEGPGPAPVPRAGSGLNAGMRAAKICGARERDTGSNVIVAVKITALPRERREKGWPLWRLFL